MIWKQSNSCPEVEANSLTVPKSHIKELYTVIYCLDKHIIGITAINKSIHIPFWLRSYTTPRSTTLSGIISRLQHVQEQFPVSLCHCLRDDYINRACLHVPRLRHIVYALHTHGLTWTVNGRVTVTHR